MTGQEKYAEKVALLLAKAESTTPEEAEVCITMAQNLMTKWAISEAMIDAARGVERDEIEQEKFEMTGIFRQGQGDILWSVLRRHNCRAVMSEYRKYDETKKKSKMTLTYTATGFRSDLDRAKLIFASLQVQAAAAQATWTKEGGVPSWYSNSQKWRARTDFLVGFAAAIGQKLDAAAEAGRKEAETEEAARTSTTTEQASESVALVLRSRKDRVDDWFDQKYGKTLRSSRRRYSYGNGNAHAAGHRAGLSADVGQSGIRGQGAIGR